MAQEEFTYSVAGYTTTNYATNQTQYIPGHDVDLIVTYDPSVQTNGYYTATAATGTYTVLNSDGTVNHTDNITGIGPGSPSNPNGVGGADNEFRIGTQPYVKVTGINYSISNSADVYSGNNGVVSLYYSNSRSVYAEDHSPETGVVQNVAQRAYVAPVTPTPPANTAPCYCTGTRILTDRGEVAIENLAIGDTVVTASGAHRPIRWIGTRRYIGRFANTNPAILPVCVKAGALADGVPGRDLWVSPDHALSLDGVLIPAGHLVNGATVVKADRVESVTYWHVELDSHDVLLAEGAPAESFVDDGGRAIFHNAAGAGGKDPHRPAGSAAALYCAPRITDGYVLETVRRRLAGRAGLAVPPARVFGALRGSLDLCDGGRVAGWAQDLAHPDGPVCLDIVVDGTVVALTYAQIHRADLQAAGIGDGHHAFDVALPQPPAPAAARTVEVRRSADGAVVGTSRVAADLAVAA